MEISAEKVKELREKSGAGMMDCKKALSATSGDLEKALEQLRKDGVVKAAKKAGRTTSEGLIGYCLSADKKTAALVEVNCETDFVARTDQFQQFVNTMAEQVAQTKPTNLESFLTQSFAGSTVQENLTTLISKVGENMGLRRFKTLQAGSGEALGGYLHSGAKIGVIVRLKGQGVTEDLARDVAMHAAAMSPTYVKRDQVPASVIEKEREIAKASPDLAGKPAQILDKIIDGKINRFFNEACLVEQIFIKDPTGKKTVGDHVKTASPSAEVVEVVRFQLGEEVAA